MKTIRLAALASSLTFVAFTIWWLADGGLRLDALMLRFGDWLLQGALDPVVSITWPLGEPQVAIGVVVVAALLLVGRRRYREAGLIAGGFLVLTVVQLTTFVVAAEIRHVNVDIGSLSHLYPSGHTARVPFLGSALALIAVRRARWWIVASTVVLAFMVAVDRTDSRILAGSVVVGGLLLGSAASLWLAALNPAWNRTSALEARPRIEPA